MSSGTHLNVLKANRNTVWSYLCQHGRRVIPGMRVVNRDGYAVAASCRYMRISKSHVSAYKNSQKRFKMGQQLVDLFTTYVATCMCEKFVARPSLVGKNVCDETGLPLTLMWRSSPSFTCRCCRRRVELPSLGGRVLMMRCTLTFTFTPWSGEVAFGLLDQRL